MSDVMESDRLEAALSGDAQQFSALAEPYRRELQAHCYRMLGSLQDAEDVVQETMLRAWRRLDTFEGRASFRAWLYKIATNAALDALDRASRRIQTLTVRAENGFNDETVPDPFPDLWLDSASGVEARYSQHESVTLAFLTALQRLPPRQRAVLVLRDVLDWRANEVAHLLEITVSAVNSALHRARTTLSTHYATEQATPSAETRALLDRYVRAWEAADVAALVALLKDDAHYSMPPFAAWYRGKIAVGQFFASSVFVDGAAYRLKSVHISGADGFAAYLRNPQTGKFHAHSLHVLSINAGQIQSLTTFLKPALFAHFGLPPTLD